MGIIRLFLALIVAADHFRDLVLAPLHIDVPWQAKLGMNAGFAVMYFYMISGFLISGALANKYPPTPGGTFDFYLSRAIRIFALYWPIALIVAIVYPLAQTDLTSAGLLDRFTKFFLFGVDWRYEFTDFPNMYNLALIPGLEQAWTLGPELAFYALAPYLLRSPKLVAVVLIASAAVRAYYVSFYGFHVVWTYVFLPSTILFFLIGHFSRWLADDILPYLHKPIAGTALLLTAIAALTLPTYAVWDSARFWIASASFAMALPGIFALTKDHTTINFFGDLSFPVYIIHKIVFVALINLGVFSAAQAISLEDATRAITLTLFAMVTVTGLALTVHQLIEKPTAVFMRRLMTYARHWKASEGKA